MMRTLFAYTASRLKSEDGIALMLVIWVMIIMMVVALSFSLTARTNAYSTLSFSESVRRDYIAEAAIQHGIMELIYAANKCPGGINPALTNPSAAPAGSGTEVIDQDCWIADGTPHTEKIGDSEYTVRVTDEAGKIDINKADEIILRGLFTALEVNDDDIDGLVDAILDWRDPNSKDVHRLHGPGNDYYMSLPRPYKQKNADFESLEELLLVKGITKELFYGIEGKRKGLVDLLTIYSKDKRIYINAAPKEVLMAIPGMGDDAIESIMTLRGSGGQNNAMPATGNSAYTKNVGSNVFTVEASVKTGDKAAPYGTKAVVSVDKAKGSIPEGGKRYSVKYWKNPAFITTQ